jgi:hypothetical protein
MTIASATLSDLTMLQVQFAAQDVGLKSLLDPLQTMVDATPPPQAVEVGMTQLLWQSGPFNDLSRIDINNANTSTDTTDWWVADAYKGQPGEADYGALFIPASYLSVKGGILTIKKAANGAFFQNNQPTLSSNYWPGSLDTSNTTRGQDANAAQNHGRFIRAPAYVDVQFRFNQAFSAGGTGFPAIWMVNWFNKNAPFVVEIDLMEFFTQVRFANLPLEAGYKGSIGFNCGDFSTGVTTYPPLQNGAYPQPTMADLGNPKLDGTDSHVVGVRLVTMAMNNGIGEVRRYWDDVEFVPNRLQYSLTSSASYPPGSPIGQFSSIENTQNNPDYKGFALYITAGNSPHDGDWPFDLLRVRVFGPDSNSLVTI